MRSKREDLDIKPGAIGKRFSCEEAMSLAIAWLEVFGRKPAPNMAQYMWHVFSYGAFPSLRGKAALDAYAAVASLDFVVLSNQRDQALISDQKPTWCSLRDYYVFPKNLAWTMAFTHEDGWLGPYFAAHPKFETLQEENLKRIMKVRQAAEARRRGWS